MRLAPALVGIAMSLSALGCAREVVSQGGGPGGTGAAGPSGGTARLDEHRTLATPVVVGNLTVWPVVTDAPVPAVEVAAFEEAQRSGAVSVRELGGDVAIRETQERDAVEQAEEARQVLRQAAAEVNRLQVENRGDVPVLICAGTVLRGGNQDRQVGEDVVVAAHSTQEIEVFCVEQGRWTRMREEVDCGVEFAAAEVVATKEVRSSAQYAKSQQAVWANVARSNSALAVGLNGGGSGRGDEGTSFLLAVEKAAKAAEDGREETAAQVRGPFDALLARGETVVGFAYAVNGKPVGVRTFANPGLLRAMLPAFVRSMALEAEAARGDAAAPDARAEDVVALVRAIEKGDAENPLVRAAHDLRMRTAAAGFNSSCVLRSAAAPGAKASEVTVTEDWTAR